MYYWYWILRRKPNKAFRELEIDAYKDNKSSLKREREIEDENVYFLDTLFYDSGFHEFLFR